MKIIHGGIAAPNGFSASGIHCGIKYKNKDLALIYSKVPCVASGVFTQNKVIAAPVIVTKKHIKNDKAQAIMINSGNANCCTGRAGLSDAQKMCIALAKKLSIKTIDVLVASTGAIGKKLPIDKITNKLALLTNELKPHAGTNCAEAIMTTDTKPKQIAVKLKIGKTEVKIGAVAKGAGMIAPNMATMLGFITTDAAIDKAQLKKLLHEAVDNSFNLISVDGDTSTNDMVVILANGLAGNKKLTSKELKLFSKALNFICLYLARAIIQDGEGASKFIEIQVEAAKDINQAKNVAFKVANSPLVKTAIFGENPNWGRVAACAGAADDKVDQHKLNIYLGSIKVLNKGARTQVKQEKLISIFKKKEIQIKINLGLGKISTKVFTCDFTHKYLEINAKY